MLAHLSKSKICDKTWSTESLKVLLSDMTAKSQIVLVDSSYNLNQNEAQDDNDKEAQYDKDDNCNFVENTQIDRTSSVSDNLEANLGVRYTYSFTPGLCLPLSLVKLIFLYTCSTKVKSRPYPYFAPVLKAGVKLTPGVIQHDLNV